jgi:hypothetical protein
VLIFSSWPGVLAILKGGNLNPRLLYASLALSLLLLFLSAVAEMRRSRNPLDWLQALVDLRR